MLIISLTLSPRVKTWLKSELLAILLGLYTDQFLSGLHEMHSQNKDRIYLFIYLLFICGCMALFTRDERP